MITCRICHFKAELADVVVGGPAGACICLRCYARETATTRPMPRALQRAITLALAESAEA